MKNTSMIRTSVYLSKQQKQTLNSLAKTLGLHQSELIRNAVDLLLTQKNVMHHQWKKALSDMKGMWAEDPSINTRMDTIRQEFDR